MVHKDKKRLSFSTRAVHGASIESEDSIHSHVPPIYQTSTFVFDDVQQGADRFAGEKEGYIYTRLGNPTVRAFEKTMADLENAEDAAAFGSGMGAISAVLLQILSSNDHIVATRTLYGCTYAFMTGILDKFDVEVTFVDPADIDAIEEAIQPNTKVLYGETPANPTIDLLDLKAFSELGQRYDIPTIIDNTFMSPYLQNPLDYGIDIVVHSATKYIGGHGDVVAGVAVSDAEFIEELKAEALKDVGAIMAPFDAWLLMRGLKTLPVRMEKHCKNAQKVASWFAEHPAVDHVYFPGLQSHPQHELARRQNAKGFGGMVSFELKGGYEAGKNLLNSVQVCTLAVSLGAADTLIQHPASMTHSTIDEEEQSKFGIIPGLVRLSVGLEDVDDIIYDLDAAIEKL